MKKLLLATAMIATMGTAGFGAAQAQTMYNEMPAGVYHVDPTHASLTWKVSHLGLSNYTARFTKFDADITFNPAKPEESTVVATIDPTSIETDFPFPDTKDFDKELVEGEGWFNAAKFPKITFASTSIERTGDNQGIMHGDLTFMGVTKPVSLDVTFNGAFAEQPFSKKPTLGFSASGTIKRSEWGMATYVPHIGDEVSIAIEAEFAQE